MLTDRKKKYLKTEISNLRTKRLGAHDAESKGRYSAKIQELKDTLEGKPDLWERSDEELNQLYEKLNRKDFFFLIGIETSLYYKKDYFKKKINEILKSGREKREKEEKKGQILIKVYSHWVVVSTFYLIKIKPELLYHIVILN